MSAKSGDGSPPEGATATSTNTSTTASTAGTRRQTGSNATTTPSRRLTDGAKAAGNSNNGIVTPSPSRARPTVHPAPNAAPAPQTNNLLSPQAAAGNEAPVSILLNSPTASSPPRVLARTPTSPSGSPTPFTIPPSPQQNPNPSPRRSPSPSPSHQPAPNPTLTIPSIGARTSPHGSRNTSPHASPRVSADSTLPHPVRRSPSNSRNRTNVTVLDWRPYDVSHNNVETIMSPELSARKAAVEKRREEELKHEKHKYSAPGQTHSHAHSTDHPGVGEGVQTSARQHHDNITPKRNPPTINTQTGAADPNNKHLISPKFGAATAPHTPGTRRFLPNAHTATTYDARSEIFGGMEAPPPSKLAAGRLDVKGDPAKKYGPGNKKKKNKASFSDDEDQEEGRESHASKPVVREIKMRTGSFEYDFFCRFFNPRASPFEPGPAPPLVGPIYHFLEHSRPYLYFSIAATIFSLFAADFAHAFLPKVLDDSVNGLLLCTLIIFTLEILGNSYSKENYFMVSFIFWLDLVGTFSLCFDIQWISDAFFASHQTTGSVARSASILRITKFARVLRILKLVRIVRVFKFHAVLQKTTSWKSATPSKVGLTLSELQDKKVIGMLMLILIIFPFFIAPSPDDLSPQMGLEMLQDITTTSSPNPTLDAAVSRFLSYQVGTNHLFFLSLPDTIYYGSSITVRYSDNVDGMFSTLRANEIDTYTSDNAAGSQALCYLNRRSYIYTEAVYSIGFTICVIFIFIFGSFLMNRDVQSLVVEPLDRMTLMVKKLAGTILFLNQPGAGGMDGNGADKDGDGKGIGGFETEAIEEVIEQMANIFQVVPDNDSHLPKSLAMLSGTKHTQIKTMNKVVNIDVSERPRQLGEDGEFDVTHGGGGYSLDGNTTSTPTHGANTRREHHINTTNGGGASGGGNEKHSNSGTHGGGGNNGEHAIRVHSGPSISEFPECQSIDSILHNNSVLPYFKLFMTSNLTLENLLYVQEVDRFRTIMKLHVVNLYNAFVSPRAPNQVNLPSLQRDKILAELDAPSVSIFDESQNECMNLMGGFLQQFQQSKYCLGYMKKHASRALANVTNPLAVAPILSHNPPEQKGPHNRTISHHPNHLHGTTASPVIKLDADHAREISDTLEGKHKEKSASEHHQHMAQKRQTDFHSNTHSSMSSSVVPTKEVYLPGSVPNSPPTQALTRQVSAVPTLAKVPSLNNNDSHSPAVEVRNAASRAAINRRGEVPAAAASTAGAPKNDVGELLVRTSSLYNNNDERRSRRSSGRLTSAESVLDSHIQELIAAEGTSKLLQEKQAAAEKAHRATAEVAARRATFGRNKSMDAKTAEAMATLAQAEAAKAAQS